MMPKCPVQSANDLLRWYSPGVAAPCQEIAHDVVASYRYTNRGNTIAIVTDGSRVLGLGDIGPEAALPVMEGKALLFKLFGGVDAIPICLRCRDANELIRAVQMLEPSFGGINLEDIAHPKCFRVLAALRATLSIPVWHDDQQGTAVVTLAALFNALDLVGKSLADVRIAMIGFGAANTATYHLLKCAGADPRRITVCDSRGILRRSRDDIALRCDVFPEKWHACNESAGNGSVEGDGIDVALAGADVVIAFSKSGPETIKPEWIRGMTPGAILFACANPVPEIWPAAAHAAGARIVATGRGDFPNQVNNSLAFPGIFRGVLDVQARGISDGMALAAADEIARFARTRGLRDDYIVPAMDDPALHAAIAARVGITAMAEGMARAPSNRASLQQNATQMIGAARAALDVLTRDGLIPARLVHAAQDASDGR
jgi:malate dehydrogenase (oxaloacetate-decarboxylating)